MLKGSPSVASFKNSYLKATPRPPTNPLFYRGDRRVAVSHSRMRVGCSSLNADLCRELHVLDSAACTCPAGDDETASHYLLHCRKYGVERRKMITALNLLDHPHPNQDLLLYGDYTNTVAHNSEIFKIVHQYISDTKRFIN